MTYTTLKADIAQYMQKRGAPHFSVYFDGGRWQLMGPRTTKNAIAAALREAADNMELADKPAVVN